MPQISVIVPVYNVEAYVEKCVRSILEQTFKDIEVLCVDNNSSDNSVKILEQLAAGDPRVRVFSMKNGGPGHSRNKGLDEARGDYILFVDSDDFLAPEACEKLLQALQKDQLDIAACEFYEYHQDTQTAVAASHHLELDCKYNVNISAGDSVNELAKFAFASPFVWGKLYRREIIDNQKIRFPAGAAEDIPFSVSCAVQAKHVKRIPDLLYYYRRGRVGNISGKADKMLLDGIKNFGVLEENLRRFGVFEEVKESFWFNKMVLLIGDERIFVGRLGNVPPKVVQQAYDLIRKDVLALNAKIFDKRNAWFRWKVRQLQKALQKNDLKFPRRLRKLRNIAMIFLDPYFKLKGKLKK